MQRRQVLLPLLLVAALLGLGGTFLVLTLPGEGTRSELAPVVVPGAGSSGSRVQPLAPPPEVVVRNPEAERDTTVLWPVRVELELLEADYLPQLARGERIGAGRTSRLSGRLALSGEEGIQATVEFVAGPNAGRVLRTDATGRFGSATLLPGLSVVEVKGSGMLSRREVRLRQGQETLLNIGYGRPSSIWGTVIDGAGEGVEGAEVSVDGHKGYTVAGGEFYVPGVAGGDVLVEISHPDFAAHREVLPVRSGQAQGEGKLKFVLRPAASLRIVVSGHVGGPGPVQVMLLPADAGTRLRREASFPWYRLGTIEMEAGSTRVIGGLPAQPCKVLAFRAGATLPQKLVHLRAGEEASVLLPLKAAPRLSGLILHEGRPVVGALVHLEPPNQARATLAFFGEPGFTLEQEVLPLFPMAQQETYSDTEGRFVFTSWSQLSDVRYLEARGPDGVLWGGRLVHGDEEFVELELERRNVAEASLVLDFPDRWQGLPVELTIDGAPLDPTVLPAHEPLVVSSLVSGRWRLEATWYGELLQPEVLLDLGPGENAHTLRVPVEAIEGQDEEAWSRAGRDYPYR